MKKNKIKNKKVFVETDNKSIEKYYKIFTKGETYLKYFSTLEEGGISIPELFLGNKPEGPRFKNGEDLFKIIDEKINEFNIKIDDLNKKMEELKEDEETYTEQKAILQYEVDNYINHITMLYELKEYKSGKKEIGDTDDNNDVGVTIIKDKDKEGASKEEIEENLDARTRALETDTINSKLGNDEYMSIYVNFKDVDNDIPIYIIFRALGYESDKEIFNYIMSDINSNNEYVIGIIAPIPIPVNALNQKNCW